jgi:DNA-binding response OmpR family regulator
MELIADGDTGPSSGEREAAAAAAMSEIAVDATAQVLADLGLTSARPYRVVTGAGAGSFVADASPSVLRMEERDLVIDAVREVIVRGGVEIADLRRRSLLKRLLFLFARSPGLVFSKEDIVQKVWEVEYHPLRHDAALFTNIMRIRRLLGDDGADLIRVSDEGYRFCPEKDFLYVEHAPEA